MGEIHEWGRAGGWQLYDPYGLPGDHHDGTPDDFKGRGHYDPGHAPTCDDGIVEILRTAEVAVSGADFSERYATQGASSLTVEMPSGLLISYPLGDTHHVAVEAASSPTRTGPYGEALSLAIETSSVPASMPVGDGKFDIAVQFNQDWLAPACQCCGGECLPEQWCLKLVTGEEECGCAFPDMLCGIEDDCSFSVRMRWNGYDGKWRGVLYGIAGCFDGYEFESYCITDDIEPGVNWYQKLDIYQDGVLVASISVSANVCGDPIIFLWDDVIGMGGDCGGMFQPGAINTTFCTSPPPEQLCLIVDGATDDGCPDCPNLDGLWPLGDVTEDEGDVQWFHDGVTACSSYAYRIQWDKVDGIAYVGLFRPDVGIVAALWICEDFDPYREVNYFWFAGEYLETNCTLPSFVVVKPVAFCEP